MPLPQPFGRYILAAPLGDGGMADVFLAVDTQAPGAPARVVKILPQHPGTSAARADAAARFDREAELARHLDHPNLVRQRDDGTTDSRRFIVQEFLDGEHLRALLGKLSTGQELPPPALGAAIVTALCRGLHYLHDFQGKGIVHRDVSPANIQLGWNGDLWLLDFGLAKYARGGDLTAPGATAGKLAYMAPEQLRGEAVDRRADVYSAGVVLWEILTGGRALADHLEAPAGAMARLLEGRIPPPSRFNPAVTPELDAIVARALTRERSDRFTSAKVFADALAPFAGPSEGRPAIAALLNRRLRSPARDAALAAALTEARVLVTVPPLPATTAAPASASATTKIDDADRFRVRRPGVRLLVSGAALLIGGAIALALLPSTAPDPGGDAVTSAPVATATAPGPVVTAPAADPVSNPQAAPCDAGLAAMNCDPPSRAAKVAAASGVSPTGPAASTSAPATTSPPSASPPRASSPTPRPPSPTATPATVAAPATTPNTAAALDSAASPSPAPEDPPPVTSPSPDATVLLTRARSAWERGQYQDTLALAERALAAGGDAHALLGAAHFKLGHYADAEAALRQALATDPGNPHLTRQMIAAGKLARGERQ